MRWSTLRSLSFSFCGTYVLTALVNRRAEYRGLCYQTRNKLTEYLLLLSSFMGFRLQRQKSLFPHVPQMELKIPKSHKPRDLALYHETRLFWQPFLSFHSIVPHKNSRNGTPHPQKFTATSFTCNMSCSNTPPLPLKSPPPPNSLFLPFSSIYFVPPTLFVISYTRLAFF